MHTNAHRKVLLGSLVAFFLIGTIALIVLKSRNNNLTTVTTAPVPTASVPLGTAAPIAPTSLPTTTPELEPAKPAFAEPIAEFKQRITKKHFGDYFTPETSPVQPERFTGYHTGVDVEYTDKSDDIPVYAIVDATVVRASWVSGYGGLLILKGSINGHDDFILCGHIRQSSMPSVGSSVKQGDQVGVLGTGNSHETDGERHHIHFAIYTGNPVDIRGYVQKESELSNWLNPVELYP